MSFSRKSTVWLGPNGERDSSYGHGAEDAWKILWRLYTAEEEAKKPEVKDSPSGEKVEYKGKSGDKAKADAYQRMENEGLTKDSPRIKMLLLDRGWVIIDDTSWSVPTLMAKTKAEALREEEEILKFLQKGPISLIFEGANMVELTMDDVHNSPNLSAAIDAAIARSMATAQSSLWEAGRRALNMLSGYDIGPWVIRRWPS